MPELHPSDNPNPSETVAEVAAKAIAGLSLLTISIFDNMMFEGAADPHRLSLWLK
jgi:hypothetical protein